MKYITEVLVDQPLDVVIREIRSKEAALKWIEGLESFELVEGELDAVGSKYLMRFLNKGKSSEMTETITGFNPPRDITTVYEMSGVWNECINMFEPVEGKTVYKMHTTFKFSGVMGLFIWLFKPIFKKQTKSGMVAFKEYCEKL